MQHENVTRPLGQPADSLRQVPELAVVGDGRGRRAGVSDSQCALALPLRLARATQHRIDGDAVQPGRERAVAAKLREFPPRLDEGLLGAVFRFTDIAGHPQAQSIHLVDMQAVQGLKCFCI